MKRGSRPGPAHESSEAVRRGWGNSWTPERIRNEWDVNEILVRELRILCSPRSLRRAQLWVLPSGRLNPGLTSRCPIERLREKTIPCQVERAQSPMGRTPPILFISHCPVGAPTRQIAPLVREAADLQRHRFRRDGRRHPHRHGRDPARHRRVQRQGGGQVVVPPGRFLHHRHHRPQATSTSTLSAAPCSGQPPPRRLHPLRAQPVSFDAGPADDGRDRLRGEAPRTSPSPGPGRIDGNEMAYVTKVGPNIYTCVELRPFAVVLKECTPRPAARLLAHNSAFWTLRLLGCDDASSTPCGSTATCGCPTTTASTSTGRRTCASADATSRPATTASRSRPPR
jgi:hypothetical protein